MYIFRKKYAMENRSGSLRQIRPALNPILQSHEMSEVELFQNNTLRPILKFQNNLFISVFLNYVENHKGKFYALDLKHKLGYIEHAVQKDMKFRNFLTGIIVGQFTTEEYEIYTDNASALNKRMMSLLVERLKDQLQLLAPSTGSDISIS